MRHIRLAISLGIIGLGAAACGAATDPRPVPERRLGILSLGGPPSVTVPSEGAIGASIEVTVVTLGGGCFRQGETEASVVGLTADVTPYDSVYAYLPPNMACTQDLRPYTHRASVVFATAGAALVRVHGRAQPGDVPIVIERPITIR